MKPLRSFAAVVAALLLIVPPSFAADAVDGVAQTKVTSPTIIGGWDGSAHRAAGVDANRALSIVNRNPAGLQTTAATIYGSTVANATEVLSSPFTNAGFYSWKVLNIISTGYAKGTGTITGGMIYRPLFSADCVTYTPMVYYSRAADSLSNVGRIDTLQIKLFDGQTFASPGFKFPLVDPVTGREIKCNCLKVAMYNRGGSSVTTTVTVEGTPEAN